MKIKLYNLKIFVVHERSQSGTTSSTQIIFDTSKQEIGNPGSNLKKFVKKYKESYKVSLEICRLDSTRIQSISKKSKRPICLS